MPGFCHLNQSELPKSANKNKNTQILQRGKNFAVFLFRESKEKKKNRKKKKQKKERRIFFFFGVLLFLSLVCLSLFLSPPCPNNRIDRKKPSNYKEINQSNQVSVAVSPVFLFK